METILHVTDYCETWSIELKSIFDHVEISFSTIPIFHSKRQ